MNNVLYSNNISIKRTGDTTSGNGTNDSEKSTSASPEEKVSLFMLCVGWLVASHPYSSNLVLCDEFANLKCSLLFMITGN